jgi:hypothetical protein
LQQFAQNNGGVLPHVSFDFQRHSILLAAGVSIYEIVEIRRNLQQIALDKYELNIEFDVDPALENTSGTTHQPDWTVALQTQKLKDGICTLKTTDNFVEGNPIMPLVIKHGLDHDYEPYGRHNIVIKTSQEWDEFLDVFVLGKWNAELRDSVIDFNVYQVIASLHEGGNCGDDIEINNIKEYADKIVTWVTYVDKASINNGIDLPFIIVKIPASNKKNIFKSIEIKLDYL